MTRRLARSSEEALSYSRFTVALFPDTDGQHEIPIGSNALEAPIRTLLVVSVCARGHVTERGGVLYSVVRDLGRHPFKKSARLDGECCVCVRSDL